MLISNLIEVVITYVFLNCSFIFFVLGWVLKTVIENSVHGRNLPKNELFISYEWSSSFWIAWGGANFLSGLLISILFADIYDSIYSVDAAPAVLVIVFLYTLFMFLWLVALYLRRTRKIWIAKTFASFALILAAINFFAIWFFIKDHRWYQLSSIVLVIPPICALNATIHAETYRTLLYSKKNASGSKTRQTTTLE